MVAILKFILWRIGSQWRSARTGVILQKRGFWATTRASVFWTSCKRAKFENRRASQERVTVVESRTHYCGSYCLASLSGEGRTDVTECTNVKVWGWDEPKYVFGALFNVTRAGDSILSQSFRLISIIYTHFLSCVFFFSGSICYIVKWCKILVMFLKIFVDERFKRMVTTDL